MRYYGRLMSRRGKVLRVFPGSGTGYKAYIMPHKQLIRPV